MEALHSLISGFAVAVRPENLLFALSVLKIPYSILFPLILSFTLVGSYSIGHSLFDVGTLIVFGVLGYLFKKLDFPVTPMAFTLILGPLTRGAHS